MPETFNFTWNGDGMDIAPRDAKRADAEFVVGYQYMMEAYTPEQQRSDAEHARYFAMVREYWQNLPESLSFETWAASAQYLRHNALIETGWYDAREFPCATNAEALRWMALLPHPKDDEGNRVFYKRTVVGTVLAERTPRSQKYRRMKKADFRKSSEDVLSFLENLIGARADGVAA